jgi:hypothetical protein
MGACPPGACTKVEVGEAERVLLVAMASHERFDGMERLRRKRFEAADEPGTEGGRFAVGVGQDVRDQESAQVALEQLQLLLASLDEIGVAPTVGVDVEGATALLDRGA